MFSGKILAGLFLILTMQKAQSQSYSGFLEDNYNGVHGILSNPANIADSRLKLDVNLAGVSAFFGNDYLGANLGDLFRDFENTFDEASKSPKNNNFLAANLDILGPATMLSMSQKHSIAVYTRGRIFLNIDDVNGNTIDKEGGFNENEDFFVNEGNISGQLNLWTEIGATYARVLSDREEHFFKGGLTVKYLSGIRHNYINGSDISLDYNAAPRQITTTGQLTQGRDFSEGSDVLDDLLSFSSSSGFGADLGLVYEWRPDHAKYTLMDANGNPKPNRGVNKYKLKLGLSITDIGRINNENGEEETYDLNATQDVDNFDGLDLDEALQENFTTIGTTTGMEFIEIKDVIACKADGSYTCFMMDSGEIPMVSKHLKECEQMLAEYNFMRVHNSYLVNLRKVKKYVKTDGGYLIMENDLQVNISPRKRDDLIEAMKRL